VWSARSGDEGTRIGGKVAFDQLAPGTKVLLQLVRKPKEEVRSFLKKRTKKLL
jgi:hypothetical protein